MDNKPLHFQKLFTLFVFLCVLGFVIYILLSVYMNTQKNIESISLLQAQKRLALANIDKEMQQLNQIQKNQQKEKN